MWFEKPVLLLVRSVSFVCTKALVNENKDKNYATVKSVVPNDMSDLEHFILDNIQQ